MRYKLPYVSSVYEFVSLRSRSLSLSLSLLRLFRASPPREQSDSQLARKFQLHISTLKRNVSGDDFDRRESRRAKERKSERVEAARKGGWRGQGRWEKEVAERGEMEAKRKVKHEVKTHTKPVDTKRAFLVRLETISLTGISAYLLRRNSPFYPLPTSLALSSCLLTIIIINMNLHTLCMPVCVNKIY